MSLFAYAGRIAILDPLCLLLVLPFAILGPSPAGREPLVAAVPGPRGEVRPWLEARAALARSSPHSPQAISRKTVHACVEVVWVQAGLAARAIEERGANRNSFHQASLCSALVGERIMRRAERRANCKVPRVLPGGAWRVKASIVSKSTPSRAVASSPRAPRRGSQVWTAGGKRANYSRLRLVGPGLFHACGQQSCGGLL